MRHFSTLSKRVEFSTRGEPGKVQVERSEMVEAREVDGRGRGRSRARWHCLAVYSS